MNTLKNHPKLLGLLVKRKNIPDPIIQDLQNELLFYTFEAQTMLKVIQLLQAKELMNFDCNSGDNKCQTRSSMLLDLFLDETTLSTELQESESTLNSLIMILQKHISQFNKNRLTTEEISNLKKYSMTDIFANLNISFTPSFTLKLASLCFITKLSQQEIYDLTLHKIGKGKIKKFTELAKIELCNLSIQYEQNLAKSCYTTNNQLILEQIEPKGFCSMTALFPSLKPIIKKILDKQQSLLQKNTIFCSCGGILSQEYNLFIPDKKQFISTPIKNMSGNNIVIITAGYQFSGSLAQLTELQGMSDHPKNTPPVFQKPCTCSTPTKPKSNFNNFKEIFLANAAQHPQFTNGAEIDWQGLGLQDSELKKEYDHLKTIPGCSIDDMSTFCIRHIYASTIADVLKEQEEMEAKLQEVKK